MDPDRAKRLAAQHAETSRLLGVDFVPAYRAGADEALLVEPKADAGGIVESRTTAAEIADGVSRKPRPDRDKAQRLLDELRERYDQEAPHKNFVTDHTNIVFGEGDPCANLMFIGEAPGAEEDKTGRPFVGRAGQLLDKMIEAMGLKREDVYIANVLKTRPPNNATPTVEEARLCAPFLYEQIRIINPIAIVTLGLPATRLILNSTDAMGSLRGHWGEFEGPSGQRVPVMPTYHPAYLLRSYTPENRGKVWADLQLAMERIGQG